MARVDYYGMEEAIKAHLEADASLEGVQILIESELTANRGKGVIITLERRDTSQSQPLAAGKIMLLRMKFSLICVGWGETLKKAAELRDDLIGKVEIAMMANRETLSDSIGTYFLEGGEFEVGSDSGFQAAGTVTVIADKRAVV